VLGSLDLVLTKNMVANVLKKHPTSDVLLEDLAEGVLVETSPRRFYDISCSV
jgi:hypothetical protein